MADPAGSRSLTLEELFEGLRASPREASPPTPFTFDDLLRELGLVPKSSPTPETPLPPRPPQLSFDQMLQEFFGLNPEASSAPAPEPPAQHDASATPVLETAFIDAAWVPSVPSTRPSFTVQEPVPPPTYEARSVTVPTPAAQPPPSRWAPWKIAVAALGVLGLAGLGYLGARRFQQLEQAVHALLAEFQRGFDGKLRALNGRIAAIEETSLGDRTQAVREVRRELKAELDELRGHREWLASVRTSAPANAAREAEAQLTRAEQELDDLFARVDKSAKR